MLSIQQLSMHFTGDDLFTDIGFLIREKDKIGLVGKNGSGKTTLLRLICGIELLGKGEIVKPDGLTIGYLPQEKQLNSEVSVWDEAVTAFEHIHRIEKEIEQITEQISVRSDYHTDSYQKLLIRLSGLNDRLSILGAHTLEAKVEMVLTGLGFDADDMHRPMNTFSNGWQMRVELAKLLLINPSFLLLDEPTNHLDIDSIQWIEDYLLSYKGALVLVSHDRAFLDKVTSRTIEISQARIFDYPVPYSEYLEMRIARIETQTASYQNQQREIKEIERFIERFRYKASKARQVQSRVKQLERMEEIEIEELDKKGIHFTFPPAPHSGKLTIETRNLSKSYGSLQVIRSLDLMIGRDDRIAFVGRNGEGKSTLSKILAGVLDYQGELKYGHQVTTGYYAQNQHEMLDLEKTVFETLDEVATGEQRKQIRAILGAFLFSGDAIDKKVRVLSGGEKARLSLAKMLLFPVNLLILDEPTYHLDMQSKDVLKAALLQYQGTLIVVSHDRDFLQGLTNKVFEFRKPFVKEFIGDVYDFLESKALVKLAELEKQQVVDDKQVIAHSSPSQNKLNWEKRRTLEREKRKIIREIERLETQIHSFETDLEERNLLLQQIGEQSIAPPDDAWYEVYEGIRRQLDQCMLLWEQQHIELDAVDKQIIRLQ